MSKWMRRVGWMALGAVTLHVASVVPLIWDDLKRATQRIDGGRC